MDGTTRGGARPAREAGRRGRGNGKVAGSRALRARGAVLAAALAASGARADTQVFVPWRYVDPAAGIEAFRMLVPKGWKVEGRVTWSANPALPAQARFRFHDPASAAEMNLFPTQSYFWTDNRLFLSTNPPGTLRFGTLVAQPVDLRTAFQRIVLPGARKGADGLKVVSERDVPELAELARGPPAAGVRSSADAGRVRVEYREGGRAVEEEFFAAVSHFVMHQPASALSPPTFVDYWFVDDVFSFRAEKGRLDARSRTFQTMIHSLKVNPRWFAKVVHVKEELAQQAIRGIRAVGRIGESVARAGSELREEQMRDWQRRQDVQDRIARNFSDDIRGVDRFYDPHAGKEVELPSGYGRAWANDLGEYVVTDSPSYDPNVGSNLHWEPMTPVR